MSLYEYVRSAPSTRVDPRGTDSITAEDVKQALADLAEWAEQNGHMMGTPEGKWRAFLAWRARKRHICERHGAPPPPKKKQPPLTLKGRKKGGGGKKPPPPIPTKPECGNYGDDDYPQCGPPVPLKTLKETLAQALRRLKEMQDRLKRLNDLKKKKPSADVAVEIYKELGDDKKSPGSKDAADIGQDQIDKSAEKLDEAIKDQEKEIKDQTAKVDQADADMRKEELKQEEHKRNKKK